MSKRLKKQATIFERDENKKLIPQEVPLLIDEGNPLQEKYKDTTVMVTPLPRGKIRRMFFELKKLASKNVAIEQFNNELLAAQVAGKRLDEDIKELGELSEDSDFTDANIILSHVSDPEYSREEIESLRNDGIIMALTNTIWYESGLDITKSSKVDEAESVEDEFAKNCDESSKE